MRSGVQIGLSLAVHYSTLCKYKTPNILKRIRGSDTRKVQTANADWKRRNLLLKSDNLGLNLGLCMERMYTGRQFRVDSSR